MTPAEQHAYTLFNAMNTRDLCELEKSLAPDAVFDFPGAGLIQGPRRILTFLKALFRKYPRLEFTVTETIMEADRVCVVWTNAGENSAGELYRNSGVTLVRLSDGFICFISDYFKDTSFASQHREALP